MKYIYIQKKEGLFVGTYSMNVLFGASMCIYKQDNKVFIAKLEPSYHGSCMEVNFQNFDFVDPLEFKRCIAISPISPTLKIKFSGEIPHFWDEHLVPLKKSGQIHFYIPGSELEEDDPCQDCDDRKMPYAERGCSSCKYGGQNEVESNSSNDDDNYNIDMWGHK